MKFILFTGIWISTSILFAQSKNEMPFTSASAEAKQLLRDAWVLYGDVKFEEGNKLVSEALQKDPAFGVAHAFILTAEDSEREKNLKKAAGSPLSADEKLLADGLLAFHLNKPVAEYFDPLLKKYPKDYDLHLLIMYYQHDSKRSAEIGELIAKSNPKYAPVYNKLGYDYMALGNLKNAETNFNKYVSLRPDLNNVYDSKGDYLMRVGKIQEAITSYEKAASMGMAASAGRAELARAKNRYAGPSEADKQKIKEIINGLCAAFLKSDVDGVLKYYADQAVEIMPNQRANVGIPNIRIRLEGIKNSNYSKYNGIIDGIDGAGTIAVAWGKIERALKLASTGQIEESILDYILMLRKQKDGQWKIMVQHWAPITADATAKTPKDSSDLRTLLDKWSFFAETGKELTQQHIDNFVATQSSQVVEIFGSQQSNIGVGNVRVRNEAFIGIKWAQFRDYSFPTNSIAQVAARKAVAWGVGDHSIYRMGSNTSSNTLFPFAMILSKEKDDQWRILVYQFYTE